MKKYFLILSVAFFVFIFSSENGYAATDLGCVGKQGGDPCTLTNPVDGSYNGLCNAGACKPIVTTPSTLPGATSATDTAGDKLGTISGGLVPCATTAHPEACTLCHFIIGFKNLIDFASKILVTVALAGIFIAGLMYIISSGDEGMMTQAKGFLKASVTGFAIVLGAWLIVNVTMWTMSVKTKDNPDGTGFAGIKKDDWFNFTCSTASSSTTAPAPVVNK